VKPGRKFPGSAIRPLGLGVGVDVGVGVAVGQLPLASNGSGGHVC
jgi:hypothetical protein